MDNELRLQAIFDQAAVGFAYIESRTGRLIKVNKKFCNIIGFKKGSASSDTFMSITHPDDLQEDLDNMEKLLKGDIREFSMEKRYIRKDGSIVWGNLTVSALWNPGQSPDYHIAIVEDITDRKKTEEDLKNLNILLDQRVEERTEELRDKSKKLEESVNF
jgi:PAS domain S-box-containing protein